MSIQWYPGHMTKARRMMQEDMRLIDLVIELTDARIPSSSRNPDIDALAGAKSRILLLNKADLADQQANDAWQTYFERKGYFTAQINAQRGDGIRTIQPLIEKACREKIERDRKRGILNRPVRAMVCGIPNVGKSTFINSFAGKAAARTGNKPGVTRGKQWIRMNKQVELLDTPGILWPKFDDPQVGMKLAAIGSVRDELIPTQELAGWLMNYLTDAYPDALPARYGVTPLPEGERFPGAELLQRIALARGCLKREGEPDLDRAGALVIDDYRKGKLGKISLEFPQATD